ncbi:MAG: FtsQ-type POTRA domain-containing protein [Lachnospiraceae bacterium]|nr:FtsQ-type POTRA domain-containing protein [Lachnospiraceae bacterium]
MKNPNPKSPGSVLKVLIIILAVILVVGGAGIFGYYWILENYTVKEVTIDGNIHYTDEEIKAIVMEGRFGNNSLYLAYKYKNREIKDLPFVETISVEILSNDTVHISVYEKTLAGFIEYLGRYIYFDRDGIVVESSLVKTQGVPQVVGVEFDHVILYEKLPATDDKLFGKVLNITKLMSKYGVDAKKMYFKPNGEIVLYQDDIVVNLGKEENLDIKIMNLPSLLKNLVGMKGTLRMENYDENTKKVTFEPDHK